MKKLLWTISVLVAFGAQSPVSLWAQTQSASFTVSVTIPEQIQLSSPERIRSTDLSGLLLPAPKFWVGEETNTKKSVDASFVMREIAGQPARVFTLTVL